MLNIARFVFNPFRENTYVAWDETLEGIVVDPGNNYPKEHDALFNFIDNQNIKLRAVVATHGH
ncbi:MAG: MBL fold metallo-hydrolase, partial [Bacteroidales bacterium]|nr:MBL fold metallo-hydrolase [Bacteroidales bacterium]